MGTDYGIGCRTCRDALPPDAERERYFTYRWHGCDDLDDLDGLRNLIAARKEIIAVADKLGEQVSFFWTRSPFGDSYRTPRLVEFLREHVGHELGPMDEYGDFDEECGGRIACAACGSYDRRCRLPYKHDGERKP